MDYTEKINRATNIVLISTILVMALLTVLVLATDFVLLIFLAILFGVFLTKTSGLVGNFLPISYGGNLAIVTGLLLTISIGGLVLFGVKIEQRLEGTSKQLDESAAKLKQWVSDHPMAEKAVKRIPYAGKMFISDSNDSPTSSDKTDKDGSHQGGDSDTSSASAPGKVSSSTMKQAAGHVFNMFQRMFETTLGLIANLGVIIFMGIFLACNPALYRDGFAKLFPKHQRDRVSDVMDKMADAMFAWLNGRFVAMLITGVGTAIPLWLLGVPMPLTIGVVTGILTFIPNIGGAIALMFAVTMAFTQGPTTALWVIGVYGSVQLIESNIITPLVQQRQTSIPPALLIGFQVILGAMTGFLGLIVATPLLASILVLVQEVWIKDVLKDDNHVSIDD